MKITDIPLIEIDASMASRGYCCVHRSDSSSVFATRGKIGGVYFGVGTQAVYVKMAAFKDGFRDDVPSEELELGGGIEIRGEAHLETILSLLRAFAQEVDATGTYSLHHVQRINQEVIPLFPDLFLNKSF